MDGVYEKIKSLAIWIPYDEVYHAYLKKLPRYETRIKEHSIPEEKLSKEKGVKKKGNSNKICPSCARRMEQQFIGIQYCRCGISWKKGMGFFERTSNMPVVLALRKIGKKFKKCPAVHYRTGEFKEK